MSLSLLIVLLLRTYTNLLVVWCHQRWVRSPPFGDLEDQRSNHHKDVILKIKDQIIKKI